MILVSKIITEEIIIYHQFLFKTQQAIDFNPGRLRSDRSCDQLMAVFLGERNKNFTDIL